jgi:tetratricopeptide (TPR) repeat protein
MKSIIVFGIIIISLSSCNYVGSKYYCMKGIREDSIKNYTLAEVFYTKAIRLNSNNLQAYANRGNDRYALADYWGSIRDYTKALRIKPDPKLYFNKGRSYNAVKDMAGAILNYDSAILLNPNYKEAYAERAQMEMYFGHNEHDTSEYSLAINDLDTAIMLDNKDYVSYNNRGYIKYRLGQYQAALLDFNKGISINPEFWELYYDRAMDFDKLGSDSAAASDYRKAKELSSKKPNIAD